MQFSNLTLLGFALESKDFALFLSLKVNLALLLVSLLMWDLVRSNAQHYVKKSYEAIWRVLQTSYSSIAKRVGKFSKV